MAVGIDVRSNAQDVIRNIDGFQKSIEQQAMVSALNRTGVTVRAAAVREIRSEYPGIKARRLRDAIEVKRAYRGRLQCVVVATGARIPLIDVLVGANKRGVRVRVKDLKEIPHAFVATMRSGHRGIFVRAMSSKSANIKFRFGKGSRIRKGGRDLPIAELTALSVPRAFLNQRVQTVLDKLATDTFIKNFTHEVQFRSSRG